MIILLPVSRSSFWPKMLGMSYERAVLWHRVASTFTLFVTGVHGIHMVHDYGFQESFSAKANCFGLGNIYGTLILGAGGLLLVLSQAPVRRYSYRTFSMAHKVLVPAVLVLSCLCVGTARANCSLLRCVAEHAASYLRWNRTKWPTLRGMYWHPLAYDSLQNCTRNTSAAAPHAALVHAQLMEVEWKV